MNALQVMAIKRIKSLAQELELGGWYISEKATPAQINTFTEKGNMTCIKNGSKQDEIVQWADALIDSTKKTS